MSSAAWQSDGNSTGIEDSEHVKDSEQCRGPYGERDDAGEVTDAGAAWLASATTHPHRTLGLWESRPHAPLPLPCGTAFDIVNAPALFGRRMVDRLWTEGPGCGPVAVRRDRMLIFAAPGSGGRLLSLLRWEEWGGGRRHAVPPLLCHSTGDAVTVPARHALPGGGQDTRWLVAPDARRPWLPGPEVLLWAAVRAVRAGVRISIFSPADQGANVYDVSRRR